LAHLCVGLQERVRADAEAQAEDLLLDCLVAPEEAGRHVGYLGRSVVHGPVDGLNLWELPQGLHKAPLVELAGRGDEDDERLAGVAPLAEDEVAEKPLVRLLVVRREARRVRPRLDRLADRVAEVGCEPAALDVEYLVPAACAMEAERDSLLGLREGVLQLVAVVEDGRGRHDRLELEALEPPDAGQGVGDLSLLRRGLRLVGEVLEAAAAAGRVMRARSVDARRAGLDDLERLGLGVISLHLRDAGTHGVAWKPAPDEDDEAVQA